jgi:hypothetical protein
MIEVQSLQRLSKVDGRLAFQMDEAAACRFARLARYPLANRERRPGHWDSPFNVNAELLNPYFSQRFWQHCLEIGAQLPAHGLDTLALDLITAPPAACVAPVQHLVSSWRHGEQRVAGAMFTSDLAFLAGSSETLEQKGRVMRDTIGALLPAHYDLMAIGFELPPGMTPAADLIAGREPWQGGEHFDVFRANEAETATISAQSLTANLFLTATGCRAECFVLDVRQFMAGTVRFVVFLLSDGETRRHADSAGFWSCALIPLVADSLRTYEFKDTPGQKSRLMERRKLAQAAARSAFGPLTTSKEANDGR